MTDTFFIFLGIALAKFVVLFGLPYLVIWKLYPANFKKFKIQTVERQAPQVLLEIKYSLSTVIIQAFSFTLIYWLFKKDLLQLYLGFGSRGYLTEIAAVLIYLMVYDSYFYWTHRLLHLKWFYQKVHVVHHLSLNPTPFASYSFHPIEAIMSVFYFFPLLYFLPMSFETLLFLLLLTDVGNLAGHVGYDFIPKLMWKSRWGSWITTPTHHNMHHQYSKSNFGLYWRGWDEFFNTIHVRTESEFFRVKDQK